MPNENQEEESMMMRLDQKKFDFKCNGKSMFWAKKFKITHITAPLMKSTQSFDLTQREALDRRDGLVCTTEGFQGEQKIGLQALDPITKSSTLNSNMISNLMSPITDDSQPN